MVKLKKGETIWTRVEIDDKQLRKEIKKRTNEIVNEISNVLNTSDLMLVGDGIITNPSLTIAAGVQEIYVKDFERALNLLCMSHFMDRKGRAIKDIAESSFSGSGTIDVDNTGLLALLYKLYEKNPLSMLDVYIRNQVINRGFDRYLLKSNKKSRPKINLNSLDEDIVNRLFKTFDKKIKDGKQSDCWHVSSQGGTIELYVRREDESVMVNKLKDNIPEMIAKSTILRFDRYGRNVDLWSEKDMIASQMLNHLGTQLFDSSVTYIPEVYSNEQQDIENLLKALIGGQDSKLILLKIQRRNAPIEGSPKITIESDRPISSALIAMKNNGIDMSSDCVINTEEIKVQFNDRNYFFGLSAKDSSVIVLPKRQKGISSELNEIDKYLRSEYKVKISLGS